MFGGQRFKPYKPSGFGAVGGHKNLMHNISGPGVSLSRFQARPACETSLDGGVGLKAYGNFGLWWQGVMKVDVGRCTFSEGCSWNFSKSSISFEFTGEAGAVVGLALYGFGNGAIVME